MTEADWTALYKVHLYAAFALCRAAWPMMRTQGYGRVVLIGSAGELKEKLTRTSVSSLGLPSAAGTLLRLRMQPASTGTSAKQTIRLLSSP
jgi:NAD(P)-dependent dehydrogenase (short-subunit alcohol dehydrogenase family)